MNPAKLSTTNSHGQVLRRHNVWGYPIPRLPWNPLSQMPKSSTGKEACSWGSTVITALTIAGVLATSVLIPLFKEVPSSKNQSPTVATAAEEINVRATNGCRPTSGDSIINLDHGDPTMYEKFWRERGDSAAVWIPGSQAISYFSDVNNLCWFLEPEFGAEIRRLHRLVGNAVADDGRYIVVGTGSSQLFQAALYALSTSQEFAAKGRPVPVVSRVPYYSSYPSATNFLRSGLFQWAGDATTFNDNGDPYIEIVCSPSNPDGFKRTVIIGSGNGKTIHDLAYYWPQYTAITGLADRDIMLFTVSKCTGHAGTRLGWALVKDHDTAKKMIKFIEVSTIGVSKDSQIRAAKILKSVSDGYEFEADEVTNKLFDFGRKMLADRWQRLREVVAATGVFSLPTFQLEYCNFMKESTLPFPAFAWLKCEREIEDCESFLRQNHKILTRSGKHFGTGTDHVRVSMLDQEETIDMFMKRISSIN